MAREARFSKPEFKKKLARARSYERQVGRARWPRYFLLGAALTVLYFLTLSNAFLVSSASVAEPGPASEDVRMALERMRRGRLWYIIPRNHILMLDKGDLLAELRKTQPAVRIIKTMKKGWPNRLALTIELREPRYVWQTGDKFYLLDQDGVVFLDIPSYTPEAFSQPLIVDSSGSSIASGSSLPVDKIIKFIEEIRKDWPAKINETEITSFAVPAARSKDIVVNTDIGFNLYFDLERSVSEQLADLRIVLGEQIRPETYTGLSYIDLRIPAIAYYCYKDAPCAPENASSTPAVPN